MLSEPILWRALRPATFDPAPAAIAAGALALPALMVRLGAGWHGGCLRYCAPPRGVL
jgi:hypothetical protein